MRVVGGSSRGRRLAAPVADGVRPTSDRVRESIFNILANLVDLNGLQVADLFAGTGALGIEALSRGAGSVTFVENDAAAFASISANLASTGLEGRKAVLKRRNVLDFVRSPDATFDLVLCDPPYSFELWDELMQELRARIAVFESGSQIEVNDRWMVLRSRRYGGTLVTVVRAREELQGESQGEPQ